MSVEVRTDAVADPAAPAGRWDWQAGEQPWFSPRRVEVPARALDRLGRPRQDVVLGWFHRYPARFAAEVVTDMLAGVIDAAHRDVTTVLDPFCGTAAAVSAARQLGLGGVGIELTALGTLIGRLRLDPPADPWLAASFCEDLASGRPADTAVLDTELVSWLGDDNARLLTAWKASLAQIDDRRLRRFATVAISQSLRPSSRWLVGSVKATADPGRIPIPLRFSLTRWARQLARDCVAERDAWHMGRCQIDGARNRSAVMCADSRRLPMADASVDAIVTSPPYFVTYDYFDVHRLSYLAFGWPVRRGEQIGAKYGNRGADGRADLPPPFRHWYEVDFGGERTYLGRALRAYTDNLRAHLAEAHRVISSGGAVAYAIANSVRRGRIFDLVAGFSQLLDEAGFVEVRIEPRIQGGRRILPAGRDVATGRFSRESGNAGVREYVVYARRR